MHLTGSTFKTGDGHYTFLNFKPFRGEVPPGMQLADPRVIAPLGGASVIKSTPGAAYTDNNATTVSPYLLMPGDKLVLGIDAALDKNKQPVRNSPQNLTGSLMTIPKDGTHAIPGLKITLYGSYVQENRESPPTLNQHLTSDAVHEAIGSRR